MPVLLRRGDGGARRLRALCAQLTALPVLGPGDELVPTPSSIELSDEEIKALRKKYRQERDKRLDARPEGNEQYERIVDLAEKDQRFSTMLNDPYPKIETPHPLRDEVEVCIVGAGYGGLCAGARCVLEGIPPEQVRLLDKAGDVGGTWYWNRYPGAACDIESYCYMPLCDEMGYTPTQKYAHAPEILEHSRLIAKTYGLYKNACFGAQVTSMVWDEAKAMWKIGTNRSDAFHARYVIMNFGTFTQAKLPGVPGVGSFEGHMFHTSRWDYSYTGGSPSGSLDKLSNKRVALVGTGATAIQVTPHVGASAKHLYVFQRTPSSVDIRNNQPTTEAFAREYLSKPGWQAERNENLYAMVQSMKGASKDLVNDGWTDIIRNLSLNTAKIWQKGQEQIKKDPSAMGKIVEELKKTSDLVQLQQMEKIRRRADIVVKDRKTADALKPWYDQFCKRPCFHDDYLATFNRPNVTLVHTDGMGIERITPKGIVANGVEHEVDCIIMATGFEVGYNAEGMGPQKLGYDIFGPGGHALSKKWGSAEHRYGPGPKTYRSHHSAGFPNLFMQNAPQGAFTVNFVYQLDEASKHFAHIIRRMRDGGYTTFDVKPEVEELYLDEMWKQSPVESGKKPGCTPGYYNNEGKVGKAGTRVLGGMYPGGAMRLFKDMEKERKLGTALDVFNLS